MGGDIMHNVNGISTEEEDVKRFDSEMDELQKLQNASTNQAVMPDNNIPMELTEDDIEKGSVYVGNVEYSSTPQDLQEHFKSCGQINRITIMVDKYTGHPKGFAYIEFGNDDAVQNAVLLSNTIFKGRQIKVIPKRKNLPYFARGRGGMMRPRGFMPVRAGYRGGRSY